MKNYFLVANGTHEDPEVFHARFWRCYRLLHFIACRVLGGPKRVADAIEKCWLRASRNAPRFEYEGAFRGWLVRVLIDEALPLLRESQKVDQGETSFRKDSSKAGNLHGKQVVLLNAATEGEV